MIGRLDWIGQVLRECPLALDAVQTSIRLGVGYPELMRLMFNGTPPANLEWYDLSLLLLLLLLLLFGS